MEHLVWWCEFLPLSELNTLIIKVPAPMQTSWISSVVVVKQSCLFIQRQNVLHFNNRFHCLQQYYLTETINLIENLRVIEYFKHIFLQDKPNINFLKNPKCSLTPTCQSASTPATVYDMDPYLNINSAATSLNFTYLCPLTPYMIIKQLIILVISWSTGNQSVSFFDKSLIM